MKLTWKSIAVFTAAVIALAASLVASGLLVRNPAVATARDLRPTLLITVACTLTTTNEDVELGKANITYAEVGGMDMGTAMVGTSNGTKECAEGFAWAAALPGVIHCFYFGVHEVVMKVCKVTPMGGAPAR